MLLVRADAHEVIGSGHIMRCIAFANAVMTLGHEVVFAVSERSSALMVKDHGFRSIAVEAPFDCYSRKSAEELADLARRIGAMRVLVDSYFISDSFFTTLSMDGELRVAYIDDMYRATLGAMREPQCLNVNTVINYGFGASLEDYQRAYSDQDTDYLIGPRYAPVRPVFVTDGCVIDSEVSTVLVTTGSTNPNQVLEKLVGAAVQAIPQARFDVVVGAHASFDDAGFNGYDVHVVWGISDLSPLMKRCDVALSAAGSTLYELSSMGVPTVAVPIVDNQLANARGFSTLGMGLSVETTEWVQSDVSRLVAKLAGSRLLREGYSQTMRDVVDGRGALRAMEALFDVS